MYRSSFYSLSLQYTPILAAFEFLRANSAAPALLGDHVTMRPLAPPSRAMTDGAPPRCHPWGDHVMMRPRAATSRAMTDGAPPRGHLRGDE